MASYTMHDYHKDWVTAKKAAKLDDKLFKRKLGPKLDDLNKLYTQLMKAGPKTWQALYDKHSNLAVEIQGIIKEYRATVNANGKNAQALKVLTSIDGSGSGHMIFNMAVDKGGVYHKYKGLF